jgi:tRNA nucleotidyltransferase/poly(A) polymerase
MANHEAAGKIILDEVEDTLKRLLLDVADFIEKNPLPAEAETSNVLLPDELRRAPLELRFAGGWVRDKLLGSKSHDIDVAINKMTGEQFGDRLQQYLDSPGNAEKYGLGGLKKKAGSLTKIEKNPEASKNLETVTTRILGLDVDLVNLRKETYTDHSRNPLIEFGTPEEDALRRDATINAMFYNISTSRLEDLTGSGLSDMENKIIRTPLEPYATFKDDPLRVLRLIRFASRFGYSVDKETKKYMGNQDIRKFFLAKITKERVWIEFEKMLRGPNPRMGLSLIDELDLYRTVFLDPAHPDLYEADTKNWSEAYNTWDALLKSDQNKESNFVSTLIANQDERFISWFLASMIPWADAPEPEPLKSGKMPPPLAAQTALAAFKAPNMVLNVLTPSIAHLHEIRELKDRQEKVRDVLGMAIRRWGASWRLQVVFAMLYDIHTDPSKKNGKLDRRTKCTHLTDLIADILSEYITFISHIVSLNILDAHTFKPIIDGTTLARALDTRPGPWMKGALDIVMAWQLRNPSITAPAAAIEEVKASEIINKPPPDKKKKVEQNGHIAKKQKKGELTSTLVSYFLRETLKPLFSAKANPEITAAGRRRIRQHAKNDELDFEDEMTKPWKSGHNRWAIELLLWCCNSVDEKVLEREWGYIIPPLLTVLDDTNTKIRAKGCNMLVALLSNCSPALLKRTGLEPLFEESLYASVTYLPSLTPEEESVILLDAALPALLALTSVSHPPAEDDTHDASRQKSLDTILRKAILQPYSHAGEHVRISQTLLSHLPSILQTMGIDSIKYLKDLLPLLSNILSDPFGPAHPPLLLEAARATESVILNAWPRISNWRGEVLKGVTVCWIRLDEEGGEINKRTLQELRKEFKTIIDMVKYVVKAQESSEKTCQEEMDKLMGADGRLKELLDS